MRFCMIGCGEHAVSSHGPAQAMYAASHRRARAGRPAATWMRTRAEAVSASDSASPAVYTDLDSMLDAEQA